MSKFKEGQLAVALIGIEDTAPDYGFIGRIESITGDDVVLVAHDGEKQTVPVGSLKQAVHYDRDKPFSGTVGGAASVFAIDHPIGPDQFVTTSAIEVISGEIGFFETKNTLYMANKIENMFGTTYSPLLTAQ